MKAYIKELGKFLDSPESITPEAVKSFYDSPEFNMAEYLEPHGGWKTYNQFFARHTKPGCRPVADIEDSRIITSPADATFDGCWEAGLPADYLSATMKSADIFQTGNMWQ